MNFSIQRRTLVTWFPLLVAAAMLSLGPPARAAGSGKLRVLTSIPDLADFARRIGGDRVEVGSITRGNENLHTVQIKPSHLVAMSKADLFIEVGLSLEVSFVPGLLQNCRNAKVTPGSPGFVNVSEGFEAIGVPAVVSRQAGDVHPQGNPHINLDPRAGDHIARRIAAGLERVDPASKDFYEANLERVLGELASARKRWDEVAESWKGHSIAVYHMEYNYLALVYGLSICGTLETRPGIPPTPDHLAKLVAKMKAEGCRVLVTAPWSNNDSVRRVAEATGAVVVEVPNQCGAPGEATWIAMMNGVHEKLAAAFASTQH